MKIKQTARGYEATVTIPVVSGTPAPPDDDGTGESQLAYDKAAKALLTYDRTQGVWRTAGTTTTLKAGYVIASTSGPLSCVFTGAVIGDKVLLVIDPTGIDPNPLGHFEPVITTNDQIQQLTGFPGAVFPVPVLVQRNQ